jgi:hypothetical protein
MAAAPSKIIKQEAPAEAKTEGVGHFYCFMAGARLSPAFLNHCARSLIFGCGQEIVGCSLHRRCH